MLRNLNFTIMQTNDKNKVLISHLYLEITTNIHNNCNLDLRTMNTLSYFKTSWVMLLQGISNMQ